jgi:hypothetical protein
VFGMRTERGRRSCGTRSTEFASLDHVRQNLRHGAALQACPGWRTRHQGFLVLSAPTIQKLADSIRPGITVVTSRGRRGWIQHAHKDKPGVWLIGFQRGRVVSHHWIEERFLTPADCRLTRASGSPVTSPAGADRLQSSVITPPLLKGSRWRTPTHCPS